MVSTVDNPAFDLPPRTRKIPVRKPVTIGYWKPRYEQAHRKAQLTNSPSAVKDHGYLKTTYPDTDKANGLTKAVIQFLLWEGHRATGISSAGRMVNGKYIPGRTRRGAADVSATIEGRSVMIEIKVGKDKPSEYQLREQQLEIKAGGQYWFIHTFDEFLEYYDSFLLTL